MKKGGGKKDGSRPAAVRPAKVSKKPKTAKAPPLTPEAVAERLLAVFPPGEVPALWKDAELKRRLATAERPVLAAALAHLQERGEILALKQGKGVFYLFAEPLRGWLANVQGVGAEAVEAAGVGVEMGDVFAVYTRLVQRSGGFPDVKIAALRAALDGVAADTLTARLTDLWREGRATLSQGDWSLADELTRTAAVELNGERYLLVRLD